MTKYEELEKLATPICKFMREHFDTSHKVIIDLDKFVVTDEIMAGEFNKED